MSEQDENMRRLLEEAKEARSIIKTYLSSDSRDEDEEWALQSWAKSFLARYEVREGEVEPVGPGNSAEVILRQEQASVS